MSDIFERLKAEFPREAISWRAQSLTKDGTKAMALAYIDARDVMNRLDEAVGPANWQCRYTHAEIKTICEISIKIDGEWVTKADGAGDSDIEAQKGAISDAFKRAAVKWGIGRYLYDMPAPWVGCESTEYNGKKQWKKWTEDPWAYVKAPPKQKASVLKKNDAWANLIKELEVTMKRGISLVEWDSEAKPYFWKKALGLGFPDPWMEELKGKMIAARADIVSSLTYDDDQDPIEPKNAGDLAVNAIKNMGGRVVDERLTDHPLMAGE